MTEECRDVMAVHNRVTLRTKHWPGGWSDFGIPWQEGPYLDISNLLAKSGESDLTVRNLRGYQAGSAIAESGVRGGRVLANNEAGTRLSGMKRQLQSLLGKSA